ncbi:MAG: hypothetical protein E6K80_08080 [Candidatus Eisenbacteria bacterium]|uniref:Uncharacterized protein n=1 Tax=Eiseniibacteriota bacterium TaxID=2212470 RepID=A0A538U3W0_UNCEI|nr:MAG: hypothetical protein E6K80_08080 [Candidatus Eisenbacteria bacterium]
MATTSRSAASEPSASRTGSRASPATRAPAKPSPFLPARCRCSRFRKSSRTWCRRAEARAPTIAATAVAAHEVGHVLQHHEGYAPLAIRSAVAPVAQIGSFAAFPLFFIGIFFFGGHGVVRLDRADPRLLPAYDRHLAHALL